eukprot:TRINITY_DN16334_c2_g1_i1.p1 TRINITY_DN16334_c2_g1~~TRINITY_DN16334_c2_g1_i1.p1  ORF type:complete len:303 (+),score=86.15 TRINITY_DN16334_c2_g1_i1:57-911(+)
MHAPAQGAPGGLAAVRPPPPELTMMNGWEMVSNSFTRMMPSDREDDVSRDLHITRLPDQCYEDCYLKLKFKGEPVLDINVLDLLKSARITKEEAEKCNLKCMYNDQWKSKDVQIHHTGVHWTYDMQGFTGRTTENPGEAGGEIDVSLLQDTTQPIRHYLSAILMEDDLEDCGTSQVTLKYRAMPTCWFALLRQFIRVDRVRVQIVDVRWFHKFGTDQVVMQRQVKQKDISDMADAAAASATTDETPPLQLYTQPDQLAQTLPVIEESATTFKLKCASDATTPWK